MSLERVIKDIKKDKNTKKEEQELSKKNNCVKSKQPNQDFIVRYKIINHCILHTIPRGTAILRAKGGFVKFYKGEIPETNENGWHKVPRDVKTVNFPDYREISGNYGMPEFHKHY